MSIEYCKCIFCGGKENNFDNTPFSNVPTPWAVHCPHHHIVYLSNHGYNQQMRRPDNLWSCPLCGETASWNDDNYEKWLDQLMENENKV